MSPNSHTTLNKNNFFEKIFLLKSSVGKKQKKKKRRKNTVCPEHTSGEQKDKGLLRGGGVTSELLVQSQGNDVTGGGEEAWVRFASASRRFLSSLVCSFRLHRHDTNSFSFVLW